MFSDAGSRNAVNGVECDRGFFLLCTNTKLALRKIRSDLHLQLATMSALKFHYALILILDTSLYSAYITRYGDYVIFSDS